MSEKWPCLRLSPFSPSSFSNSVRRRRQNSGALSVKDQRWKLNESDSSGENRRVSQPGCLHVIGPDLCPHGDPPNPTQPPTSLISPICHPAILLGGCDRFGSVRPPRLSSTRVYRCYSPWQILFATICLFALFISNTAAQRLCAFHGF